MEAQQMQESREALINRKSWASTLCLSVMLVGAFTISILATPAYADGKKRDRDQRHSLVVHPYSDHSLRNMVSQLQAELLALKALMATTSTTSNPNVTQLQAALKAAQDEITLLKGRMASAETRLTAEEQKPASTSGGVPGLENYVSINTDVMNGVRGPHIVIRGVNVHVLSGSGATVDNTGLGNLIVGYNESTTGATRGGSHNLVGGTMNSFSSSGGLVFGTYNRISGQYSSILGGAQSTASGMYSTVYGGQQNQSVNAYEFTPAFPVSAPPSGGGGF
jgi:hypothetical protein